MIQHMPRVANQGAAWIQYGPWHSLLSSNALLTLKLLLLLESLKFLILTSELHTHTHKHLMAFFSRTTSVGRYQKDKPFWILLKQEMMERQWHQLNHMQIICTSLQTVNHASTSSLHIFRGRMPFLLPNQQRQSTEGKLHTMMINK